MNGTGIPREGSSVYLTCGNERSMRTTKAHWHTEALGRPDRNVYSKVTRRTDQHAGEKVGGRSDESPRLMG